MERFYVYVVWASIWGECEGSPGPQDTPTKSDKKIFVYNKQFISANLYFPGLVLISFQTSLLCLQQVKKKKQLVSGQFAKRMLTLPSSKLEPAIWMPCFDRCQLTITWISRITKGLHKPRVHVSVNLSAGV